VRLGLASCQIAPNAHAFTAGADLASGELATPCFFFASGDMAVNGDNVGCSQIPAGRNNIARSGDVARASQIYQPVPAPILRGSL
jgi:hypothetical protein